MAAGAASEHDIQCNIADYYRRFRVPGSFMTISLAGVPLYGGRANAMSRAGYRAGTPDMVFCYRGETLWLELKREDGGAGLSDNQSACLFDLREAGVRAVVCNGFRAAIGVLADFGVVLPLTN